MKKFILLVFLVLLLGFIESSSPVSAIDCEGPPPSGDAGALQQYQDQCEAKISELQSQAKTLSSVISLLNSKINLTQAQIRSTNNQIEQLTEEIGALSVVIGDLNKELDTLSRVYISRVRENYKNRHVDPLITFLSLGTSTDFQSKIKYLETTQKRDQIIMHELESARINYDEQKTTKEEKQAEVEELNDQLQSQQKVLGAQQSQKQTLLDETKNNEKVYQERLAKAVAELRAIESIIAGQGSEQEVGSVSVGERIASIIPSASACSSGAHLHFEVVNDKVHQDPFNYLKSTSLIWDNADPARNGTGSWNWPIKDPIRITQGYGHTSYSSIYANNTHTGVDMVSPTDYEVLAAQPGTLYRGSIKCGGGTLKYVHVKHNSDNLDTYYLHVNYF